MNHQEQYLKDIKTLKKRLHAEGCAQALDALAFAEEYHPGFRANNETPNFHHQVRIAFSLYDERENLRAAKLNLDEVITLGILHDTLEDNQHLKPSDLNPRFGSRVAEMTETLSKVRNGKKMSTGIYYAGLLAHPETIIVKLHDRRDNNQTIFDLKPQKQLDHVVETRHLLTFAEAATKKFPKMARVIRDSQNRIESYLDLYLGFARNVRDGSADETVRLLDKASLLGPPAQTGKSVGKIRSPHTAPIRYDDRYLLDRPENIITSLDFRCRTIGTLADFAPQKQLDHIVETRRLLETGKAALEKYPRLESLIQNSRTCLKAHLGVYLGFARKMRDGQAIDTIELLDKAGLLGAPMRPPSRPAMMRASVSRQTVAYTITTRS